MVSKEIFLMKPKVDFCFKELMEDSEVRRGFISALLGVAPEEIVHTELRPTHLRKEHAEDKLGILDVRVLVNGKTQMDIEIQMMSFPQWPERSLYYLGKMYVDQIKEGEEYSVLQKCIHVGLLDFILFEEDEEFYSRFHLWEDTRRRMYIDKLEIHVLELPKLAGRKYPETELLKWARFFNAEKKEEFEMTAETNPYINRAYERLTKISADEEKRWEYEAREKAIRDHNWMMKCSREEGLKEGLKEGLEQGRKAALEQGIQIFILDNLEEQVPKDRILSKMVRRFELSMEQAEELYLKYSQESKEAGQ